MSALASIQQEWAENTAEKSIIGVLLWDLSAAFTKILCEKIYHWIWNLSNNIDLRKQDFLSQEKYVFIIDILQKAATYTYFFLT